MAIQAHIDQVMLQLSTDDNPYPLGSTLYNIVANLMTGADLIDVDYKDELKVVLFFELVAMSLETQEQESILSNNNLVQNFSDFTLQNLILATEERSYDNLLLRYLHNKYHQNQNDKDNQFLSKYELDPELEFLAKALFLLVKKYTQWTIKLTEADKVMFKKSAGAMYKELESAAEKVFTHKSVAHNHSAQIREVIGHFMAEAYMITMVAWSVEEAIEIMSLKSDDDENAAIAEA